MAQGNGLLDEHVVQIDFADDVIGARMEAVRDACTEGRFGACSVLQFDLTTGRYPHGTVVVRVVPEGVEPLAKLLELQGRKDLSVSDLLAIANESAAVEAELEAGNRAAADQLRRLETNLLTMHLSAENQASAASRIGESFKGAGDSLIDGVAEAIEMAAYWLPFLLIAFPLALLWRWLWRRVTRPR